MSKLSIWTIRLLRPLAFSSRLDGHLNRCLVFEFATGNLNVNHVLGFRALPYVGICHADATCESVDAAIPTADIIDGRHGPEVRDFFGLQQGTDTVH